MTLAAARDPAGSGRRRYVTRVHNPRPRAENCVTRGEPSLAGTAAFAVHSPQTILTFIRAAPAPGPVPEACIQTADMDTAVPARSLRLPVVPSWVNRLIIVFAIYVVAGAAWMLSGAGGSRVTFYVGLSYKLPGEIAFISVAAATALRMAPGALRSAWWSLASALALYFIGDLIGFVSWLLGHDPFPGPSDFLY